jgi:outer membrane receptor protein involved in Fe transport
MDPIRRGNRRDDWVLSTQPKWDVQFGIKNIADVTYYTTALSAGGYVGEPQTFYAKANWRY